MSVISPIVEIVGEGMIIRWMGLLGNAILADCDVGEHTALPVLGDRMLHLWGGQFNSRLTMEFNSDPDNMPWMGVTPTANHMLITPGRPYASSPLTAVWPAARFVRPRIYSTTFPASAGVDVFMFCANGA